MSRHDTSRSLAPQTPHVVVGEARWPMALAVVAVIVLTLLLPDDLSPAQGWVLPAVEGLLLVALIAGDPGRIDRRSTVLRAASIALVGVLAFSAVWSTIRLVDDIIHNGKETSSADSLLQAGGTVWVITVLAFSLLYFELDSGGAAARAHHVPRIPQLAFPQHLSPEVHSPQWRPRYIDYLYLALTNATAFSPTDVMPLAPWAKIAMSIQALVSLLVLGLVIARAVNVLV
ncbi:hypothetical protein OG429_03910 [Streptomyces sp. NBC_00190]|uniref:hypothetical protein n=1 Tax=unclassified Streptomyces TaxID=2593676 RepID=UPI002E2A5A47|nr:hypothetical protein [Streptomyces sp. NBC_00190]WSZ38542.1 hypothetical protein OG239_06915 [Streptomyces sp. NBC_00868]